MVVEVSIICITVFLISFLLLGPIAWAKAQEIQEKAHKLEIETMQLTK